MRLLLHSIAFGNLKLVAPRGEREQHGRARALAQALGIDEARLGEAADRLFAEGDDGARRPDDAARVPGRGLHRGGGPRSRRSTRWGRACSAGCRTLHRRGLFAADARVIGLTSEGNEVAWKGYAAVAAAKVALESVSRAIAVEMAPLRHPLERRPGRRDRHARAAPHPRQRAPQGRGAPQEPVRPADDAGGRRPRDPPAVPARGRLDQRRGDPRRRRRARLGGVAVSLYLHGLGHFHPENEITNRFLEDLDIGTTDAWIMERVGIRSRRTVLPLDYIRETRNRDPRMAREAMLYGNAETGRRAAEMAIARAGIDAQRHRHGDLGQLARPTW